MYSKCLIALALGAKAAKYDRSFELNVKDTAVSSIEAANLQGEIETQVTDQLAAGGSYEQTSAKFAPKSLFTRWTSKGGDPLEVTATYNVASNSAEVDVEYEKSGTTLEASLDSARRGFVSAASLTRTMNVEGRDVTVTPSYDFATKLASLKTVLGLSSDTDVELNLESADLSSLRDDIAGSLTVSHAIDAQNSIKPTFNIKSGDVDYEYTRKLDGDAELKVEATPGKDINVAWDDAGSNGKWTTNVAMPWGKPVGASVSFKRKFSL
jgi:hypothetical protein